MPSAIAAEVVVLPTPPGAGAHAHLLAVEQLVDHSRRSSSAREPLELLGGRARARTGAAGRPPAPRARVAGGRPWARSARARRCSESAARGGRAGLGRPAVRASASSARASAAVNRCGEHAVQHDRVELHAQLRAEAAPRARSSRSPASPPAAPRATTPVDVRVAHELVDDAAPGGGSGPPGPRRRRSRGARSMASPWPVAGASTMARSYTAPVGAPLELRQVPDLAHRHQLGEAGRRRGQVLEDAAAAEHAGQRARLELVAQPLLLGALRVDASRRTARAAARARPRSRSRVAEHRGERCWSPTSHTTTRLPRRAAASPSAAATVVLPTPPLPVTSTRRLSSRGRHRGDRLKDSLHRVRIGLP